MPGIESITSSTKASRNSDREERAGVDAGERHQGHDQQQPDDEGDEPERLADHGRGAENSRERREEHAEDRRDEDRREHRVAQHAEHAAVEHGVKALATGIRQARAEQVEGRPRR
jgi:hypothetical protein